MHALVPELPDVLMESPPFASPELPETAFPPPGRPTAGFEIVTPPGPPLAATCFLSDYRMFQSHDNTVPLIPV